jgi:SNF2 family DNA or RNA helicase
VEECKRFSPQLNPILFSDVKNLETVKDLGPMDIVIASYALLTHQAEKLTSVDWQTAILDEAQYIKNSYAKRSQVVMQLKATNKLILTGTPIENHLGELWNLFRFINPGLLGTWKSFQERFLNPIERSKDVTARHSLKKLIQPFILRRLKNKVLKELPAKTETTLMVESSEEEKTFYEALRQQAVEKLSQSKQEGHAGKMRIQILAEITKLRRACCHSSLVQSEMQIPSKKLKVFMNLVNELKNNQHKALVFSQFVGFLDKIREVLDDNNISYQYLDGSTPVKVRRDRVDAFQRGEGDLFLISLKAGGTGLNLTAADYVIHMDPWWNPAVEDQASDRAHRIGQERPVTVYRMITAGSIEEKIFSLHDQKRTLAEDLLSGTDTCAKLTEQDLVNLIKE